MDEDIENQILRINMEPKKLENHLKMKYDWDILAARGVWAFGPEDYSPNVLLNDTLPMETDQ